MEVSAFFPVWGQLSPAQRDALSGAAFGAQGGKGRADSPRRRGMHRAAAGAAAGNCAPTYSPTTGARSRCTGSSSATSASFSAAWHHALDTVRPDDSGGEADRALGHSRRDLSPRDGGIRAARELHERRDGGALLRCDVGASSRSCGSASTSVWPPSCSRRRPSRARSCSRSPHDAPQPHGQSPRGGSRAC